MSLSLRDILSYQTLTGMVNAAVPGLPVVLPEAFRSTVTKVSGNTGRYTRQVPRRTTATLNKYGAQATPVNQLGLGQFDVQVLSTFEQITLDPMTFLSLRGYDNYNLQDRGKDEVARQAMEFARRSEHLRNVVDIMALSRGKIWSDANGNLLPTSSSAVTTCDFGIPSAQVGATIATFTGISGAWTSDTTDIPTQLLEVKRKAERAHGYVPEIVLYGRNIPYQLATNQAFQYYAARNPSGFKPQWLKDGDIKPDYQIFGFNFFPAYNAFWNDQNGSPQEIVDDNAIIFLPSPSQFWWDHMEGEQLVPTTFQPTDSLEGANMSFKSVHGRGMYALQTANPLSMSLYAFDNRIPVIKVPDVVYSLVSA